MLDVATYAYHNGELTAAVRYLDKVPDSPEAAILRVKCLCELDQPALAHEYATLAARDFPASGALQYYRGMALCLARGDAVAIAQAFQAAAALGDPSAPLGLAFVAYAAGDLDGALENLLAAPVVEAEMAHVRLLMLFQVAMDQKDLAAAERYLEDSDRVLRGAPSLLRSYWGQLCWVRFLNISRSFELAAVALRHLKAQLSSGRTPRLYRNVLDLELRLASRDGASEVNLPGTTMSRRAFDPTQEIASKPTLSCLFHFLAARGDDGATKDEIVRHVWDNAYNPVTHDDRLYKSIGRLRKLLERSGRGDGMLFLRGAHYVLTPGRAHPELLARTGA